MRNSIGVGALLMSLGAVAAEPAAPPIEFDGLIEPNITVELRSAVDGVIQSIEVDRSAVVTRDQVLVKLHAPVEEAAFAAASAKAEYDKRKMLRARQLHASQAIPFSEKDEAESTARLSELQMRHAQETLNLRTIRSPIDGVVVERYLSPGESVKDKTILKLAQIDPLRVEVVLPAALFGQIKPGMRAEVKPELAAISMPAGKVVLVDKVVDGASGTFIARVEIPNADHAVPSGLRCKVRFFNK